jgi:murein DD-endopeptidase MepM/ murein hydrolase activator NlpD
MRFVGRLIRRGLLHLFVPAVFLGVGWYGGAKYGAPDLLINAIDGVLVRGERFLSPIISRGAEEGGRIAGEAARRGGEQLSEAAADAGDYVVGTVESSLEALANVEEREGLAEDDAAGEARATGTAQPASGASAPRRGPLPTAALNGDIVLCQMRISNAPRGGDPAEAIGRSDETGTVNGVRLMLKPATKSCLSSGFGYRGGRLHKGVDYFSDMGGDALAAGAGTVVERVARSDYGNMVVIDHGSGVYTRYAHLARFGSGVREGASVKMGQVLGPIGMTGASSIVHLHYEVLTGDINTNAGSFGLEAVDPFGL